MNYNYQNIKPQNYSNPSYQQPPYQVGINRSQHQQQKETTLPIQQQDQYYKNSINQQQQQQLGGPQKYQQQQQQQQNNSSGAYGGVNQFNFQTNSEKIQQQMLSSKIQQSSYQQNNMFKSSIAGGGGSITQSESVSVSSQSKIVDNSTPQDRAVGCLFGAFLGDTMGSYLEFYKQQITEQKVNEAYSLPGGGIHKIAKGQLTDDGELSIMLAQGILECQTLDINQIMPNILEKYYKWCNSSPFDFGLTMQESWNPIMFKKWDYLKETHGGPQGILQVVYDHVKKVSQRSQSNGFLMKQAPLGIFLWNQSRETIFAFAEKETLMTHADQDQFKIFTEIRSFAWQDKSFCQQTRENFQQVEQCFDGITESSLAIGKKPKLQTKSMPNFSDDKIGWVKIAFSYCLYALLDENISPENIFKGILKAGGDTDTNLCIVGALIGALRGMAIFPVEFSIILERCDPSVSPQPRPRDFRPSLYKQLSLDLFKKAEEMNSGSPKKNNSQLLSSKIQSDSLKNQTISEIRKKEIKQIRNCTIDLLENCNVYLIENCLIKVIKGCKITTMKQSRLGELVSCQIQELYHTIIQDTEMNIEKKDNRIFKKAETKFGILLI